MTHEEKAKAYDEALERAKKFAIDDAYASQGIIAKLIFPELRESEDERIRKQLLDFLEHLHSQGTTMDFDVWCKADCANWILWVEKQKEQKPCGCVNVESEYDKGWRDGHKAGLKDAEMQKPAWSEEDERTLKGIIGKIEHDQTYGVSKAEMLSFLKSIRPSWKPSEEQMAWLKLAIDEAKEPLKSQLEELYKNIRENLIWK